MSKKKEPAMSEFKVGDWVKRTDKITESIYQISSIDKGLIKCNFIKNGENWRLHTTKGEIEYATPEEIAAGHRIDKPSNSGELETLDKPENHISLNCKVEELKASHHGEVIGHEVHFKKIKQERDELQTLYIQQGINMLKMQKRVDEAISLLVEAELYQSEPNIDLAVKALKGEGQ
ncbi:hypothetical protein [Acinetobacter nosocomialis]|uniref:hypothetical protein n=2 Tax=Acinetobacter nosocomialis TaxID=106654 RepID=UPI00028DA22B|nr:hypothetical protein [Acinetobacter nosocomialis]EKF46206.1 hypothetical protein W9I_03354 [Acinetobacter nosocomialis Ab22222]